jgi:glycolate oxidase iron-sulfur subunit
MTSQHSHLKNLDYSVVQQCMHCGLCLPTCPTYDATKLERNSPRGRIALMRAIADDRLEVGKAFGDEMYFCLGCLACMTACPAGVNYAELFEHARAEIEEKRVLSSPKRNLIRAFAVKWLFMEHARLQLFGKVLRFYQQLGLQTLVRKSGILKLLSKRLRELESITPTMQPEVSSELIAPLTLAAGEKKYRVALLTGCAQDLIFSDINRDTVEVLAQNGCEVFTPPDQQCCGSLHAHNGEWALAQHLARKQINQFPPEQFDAIITNAGGCGSHLKHYAKLLADDPAYRERARLWDEKVKDIHEWLAQIGIRPPNATPSPLKGERAGVRGENIISRSELVPRPRLTPTLSPPSGSGEGEVARTPERFGSMLPVSAGNDLIVTYHESCHLSHGQKVVAQPRQLLKAIPNLKLVELPEATWCCGSAGIYNLVQPEMADQLLDRKLKHIRSTGATIVATGNPGCLLQLINGAKKVGLPLRVAHPVSLLAEAYRTGSISTPD